MEYRLRNIPVENHRQFKALAAAQGVTVNQLFLMMIDSYVKENPIRFWWSLTDDEREEITNRVNSGEVDSDSEQEKDFFSFKLASGRTVQGSYSWGQTDPAHWWFMSIRPGLTWEKRF